MRREHDNVCSDGLCARTARASGTEVSVGVASASNSLTIPIWSPLLLLLDDSMNKMFMDPCVRTNSNLGITFKYTGV